MRTGGMKRPGKIELGKANKPGRKRDPLWVFVEGTFEVPHGHQWPEVKQREYLTIGTQLWGWLTREERTCRNKDCLALERATRAGKKKKVSRCAHNDLDEAV
jgi:hypothetical protein